MTEDQFEKLAQLINGAHEDLTERMDRFESRMDGFESRMDHLENKMAEGFLQTHSDIRAVNQRLDVVENKVDNIAGVTKEVDYILDQISAIKLHVGMAEAVGE